MRARRGKRPEPYFWEICPSEWLGGGTAGFLEEMERQKRTWVMHTATRNHPELLPAGKAISKMTATEYAIHRALCRQQRLLRTRHSSR